MTNHNGSQPSEGWPLFDARQTFGTVAGFYACLQELPGSNYPELQQLGCESVIAGVPHYLGLKLAIGDQVYDADMDLESIKQGFLADVDFKKGIHAWRTTWSPRGVHVSLDMEITSFVHRLRPNVAGTQLKVTAHEGDVNCTIIDIFDGRSAVRSNIGEKGLSGNSSMYVSLHPDGQPNVTAWLVSTANISNGFTDESSRNTAIGWEIGNNMTTWQQWDVHLVRGKTAVFEKFVGIASTDKFPNARKTAHEESLKAFRDGWDTVIAPHVEEWKELMAPNHITSYRDPITGRLPENETSIEKLQIAAVADAYYLLQNLQASGSGLDDAGVAVGGLTSDTYGGMLFWDQEFWMFPAILAHWPNYARQILLARVKHLPQAQLNAQAPYVQEEYKFPPGAALYSWTAGKFGNATSTGPALNYEYHINSDIGLAAFWYRDVTGDEAFFKEKFWPMVLAIGRTVDSLLIEDENGYSIHNMTDPDEFHVCLF
jgi:trehalose/maltose hydrolase-like predicted phosphorylase